MELGLGRQASEEARVAMRTRWAAANMQLPELPLPHLRQAFCFTTVLSLVLFAQATC
jgi:hypothetical protein